MVLHADPHPSQSEDNTLVLDAVGCPKIMTLPIGNLDSERSEAVMALRCRIHREQGMTISQPIPIPIACPQRKWPDSCWSWG